MKHALIVLIILFVAACKEQSTLTPIQPSDPPSWNGHPELDDMVMYEVNLRAFSNDGSINGLIARLDSVKSLGVNMIWVMPPYPVGILKGINSPYCIKDYTSIGVEYGTINDFKRLVDSAHAKGMGIILDWVANHTSWDHPWTKIPGFHTVNSSGAIIHPPGTNWTDVADLNFGNPNLRDSMIAAMKWWIKECDIDGFRCDYADGVPADFWSQAIRHLDSTSRKSLLFLAEGTRGDHFSSGFDLIFSWNYYSALKSTFSGGSATSLISTHVSEYNSVPTGKHRLRFTTNHDESAWDNSPIVLFKGMQGALSASVITIFLEGVPLFYSGQEIGRSSKTPFFTRSPINWSENPAMLKAYQEMIGIYKKHEVARKGMLEPYQYQHAVCFKKTYQGKEMLVLANVRNQQTIVSLPVILQNTAWNDALKHIPDTLKNSVTLAPYEYRIFLN
ncbi:MAG: alpha-amylase family glycosyl hydrolase [Candidatus Kapaibacteriota bacterium]